MSKSEQTKKLNHMVDLVKYIGETRPDDTLMEVCAIESHGNEDEQSPITGSTSLKYKGRTRLICPYLETIPKVEFDEILAVSRDNQIQVYTETKCRSVCSNLDCCSPFEIKCFPEGTSVDVLDNLTVHFLGIGPDIKDKIKVRNLKLGRIYCGRLTKENFPFDLECLETISTESIDFIKLCYQSIESFTYTTSDNLSEIIKVLSNYKDKLTKLNLRSEIGVGGLTKLFEAFPNLTKLRIERFVGSSFPAFDNLEYLYMRIVNRRINFVCKLSKLAVGSVDNNTKLPITFGELSIPNILEVENVHIEVKNKHKSARNGK